MRILLLLLLLLLLHRLLLRCCLIMDNSPPHLLRNQLTPRSGPGLGCFCLPAVKQDLLLAFVDCVERNGAKLARQRLQLEVGNHCGALHSVVCPLDCAPPGCPSQRAVPLHACGCCAPLYTCLAPPNTSSALLHCTPCAQVLPSLLPPGGGMPGSIIDVPALPQPVDVTATPASSSSGSGGGSSGAGPSSSGSGGTASNIVPAAKEGGSSSGGSKEGGGGGKGVTVTLASSSGATPQQELAAQAVAATAAAVLQDPATLSKIAAAISPDDIIANTQTAGINVLASYDVMDEPQR